MLVSRGPRWSEWLVAALVGAALLFASNLLVPPPDQVPAGHPERFAYMAQAPFAFDGQFPHRILWPLLAHVAGWFGLGPVGFSQTCSAALLAVVVWFARQRGAAWLAAGLIGGVVAASGAVLVYRPLACYSDPLSFALLLLTVHHAARPFAFWLLVFVGALSHEFVFFFAPWLVWLRREAGGTWRGSATGLAGAMLAYAGWRFLVKVLTPAAAPTASYDALYYVLNNFWVPWLLPGLWALLLQVMLAEFGASLALAVAAFRARVQGTGGAVGALLFVGCLLSLEVLAYDVMRFASFAFVPVVLGGVVLANVRHGTWCLVALLVAAVCGYAWDHPVAMQQGGRTFTRLAGEMMALVVPHVTEGSRVAFGDALAAQRAAFAQQASTWLWIGAALVAIVGVGLWLGKRLGQDRCDAGQSPSGSVSR